MTSEKKIEMVRQSKPGMLAQKYNVISDGQLVGYVKKARLANGDWEPTWEAWTYIGGTCRKVGDYKDRLFAGDEVAHA